MREELDFRLWHKPAVAGRAEHVRSARKFLTGDIDVTDPVYS
jgi:hypothetical protein